MPFEPYFPGDPRYEVARDPFQEYPRLAALFNEVSLSRPKADLRFELTNDGYLYLRNGQKPEHATMQIYSFEGCYYASLELNGKTVFELAFEDIYQASAVIANSSICK